MEIRLHVICISTSPITGACGTCIDGLHHCITSLCNVFIVSSIK